MLEFPHSKPQAAFWRRLAARAALLRSRLPARPAALPPSAARAWLDQLEPSCPSLAEAQRARAACLSQADYAQATASQARALLLAAAGEGLLPQPGGKKTGGSAQVPHPAADSSGKE